MPRTVSQCRSRNPNVTAGRRQWPFTANSALVPTSKLLSGRCSRLLKRRWAVWFARREGSKQFDFDAMLPIEESFKLRGWREYASAPEAMRANTPQEIFAWFAEAERWDGDRIARFETGIAKGVTQATALFDDADFLLTPVMPVVNFPATERAPDPLNPVRHCTFTAPFNQSGHPAAVICAGLRCARDCRSGSRLWVEALTTSASAG